MAEVTLPKVKTGDLLHVLPGSRPAAGLAHPGL